MKIVILLFVVFQQLSARTALRFDKEGYIGLHADTTPLEEAFTICSWVKRLSFRHKFQYWFSYITTSNEQEIFITDTATGWLIQNMITREFETPSNKTEIEWHHICATWSFKNNVSSMYYDGMQVWAEKTGERKLAVPGGMIFGQWYDAKIVASCCYFGGELYDANIFSTQLTDKQVKELFAEGRCPKSAPSFMDDIFLSWVDLLVLDRPLGVTERELDEDDCKEVKKVTEEPESYGSSEEPVTDSSGKVEKHSIAQVEKTTEDQEKSGTHSAICTFFWPYLAILNLAKLVPVNIRE